jgi:hypothetical protein
MYEFSKGAIPAVAGDVGNVVRATDTALSVQAQMLTTVIEAAQTSNLPLNATERVYGDMIGAMTSLLDARTKTRRSVSAMTAIGRQSPHAEFLDGCPAGFPLERNELEPCE